ncbi:coproporphyrinogen III oxidase [Adonisia turfae]|uniref:Uncharacterized protein n=1 Tax=Adonisia turfae CCMR0081 TaxID=2292702 RepID=A0A6M0RSX0_9CYAN|nr:coproporphyrinogen III oxidase [Adonisia turfae]NEZ59375.1 hypothetical protein [Adonisia turfae CCMR0081]
MSPPVNPSHAKAAVPAADSALGQLGGQTKFQEDNWQRDGGAGGRTPEAGLTNLFLKSQN